MSQQTIYLAEQGNGILFLMDWSFTSTVVMTMWRIVGSIVKEKASGGKWLIYEAVVDIVRIYIYCSGDDVDDFLKLEFYQMVEE